MFDFVIFTSYGILSVTLWILIGAVVARYCIWVKKIVCDGKLDPDNPTGLIVIAWPLFGPIITMELIFNLIYRLFMFAIAFARNEQ